MNIIPAGVRLAIRSLLKRPGFTVPIVLTLALGIGVNTAVSSLVYALVLTGLLYQVTPADPWVLGATCLASVAVTLAACDRLHV